ncbi:type-F conjugative transfer system secretin TraK [Aquabacterium humicola]|uniref:type-F conjugative transfer system secretin TraK n=1 Tax=Aquabacterium humicola TaxID=3237377 RepID=UPI002542DE75|nr:type-F conjugative transfer system secretin TraK [Rubrivivax pictus]
MRPRSPLRSPLHRWHAHAAWAAILATPVHALQVIDVRDGVAVEAILSIKEPTRIRIEGAAITDVFGNIYATSCGGTASTSSTTAALPGPPTPAVNPAGEVVLECDRDKGEIYVRPVGHTPDGGGKPVNLFISSAHATYTLVLRRSDTPADTIVLRDRTMPPALPAMAGSPTAKAPLGPSPSHVRAMKALLVAMASDRALPDIRVEEIFQPVQLWSEARFALASRFVGRGLVGERYSLTNISSSPMVLAEQEFDRPDGPDGDQVLGVAIEHHNLRPGDSTSVYVIRRRGPR